MRLLSIPRLALKALARNVTRTLLTMLGIVIGVAAVICVVAIGDGATDLDMLEIAGLGIAYNAKGLGQEAADTTMNVPYLDAIMYLLGISREEIEALDLEHGVVTPAPPLG